VRNTSGRDSSKPYVTSRPTLSPSVFVGSSRRGRLPAPLDADGVTFYIKARNGLWELIRALGVQGSEIVLVPAYNCGPEVDAVLKAPATVRFYRVDSLARIDVDHLRQAIEPRTRAVVVTHYFGFPQPELPEIVDLCRDRGLFLIEDCAPALYSTHLGRPLGTFGDAGIFSLWKTLPMPNGGAVLVNGPLHLDGGTVAPPFDASFTVLRSNLEGHMLLRHGRAGWFTAALSNRLADLGSRAGRYMSRHATNSRRANDAPPNPRVTFDRSTADWSMSRTAHRIAYRSPHSEIVRRRRQNYTALAAELAEVAGARTLHQTLPDGTCPLRFPLVVDEPSSLLRHLESNGIGAELFWSDFHPAFPAQEFPESTYLKTHIVAVPNHQDLDAQLLARIADAIREWSRSR
jgi:perosamine synthetase